MTFIEGGTRLIFSVDPFLDQIKGNDDASMRLKWVKRRQDQKEEVYSGFDVFDPSKGWALQPNLRDFPVWQGKFLNSNSRGLRGKAEYSYRKLPGKRRILVFGDSFTFGEQVSDDETFSHYLGEMLPGTEVINFGVHGYGHDQILIFLKEEGVKYQADVVILGFVHLNMPRNLLEFRDYAKPSFELVNNNLRLRTVPVPSPEEILRSEAFRIKTFDLFTILYQRLLWETGVNSKRMEEITTAILDEMIETITGMGVSALFAYLPVREEIESEEVTPGEKYLLAYCRDRGIECISLRPHFIARVREGVKFRTSGHWSARGHLVVAQGIKEYLLAKNLIGDIQEDASAATDGPRANELR